MFVGPIYIVGMPRSGTKLLRDLMNQHDLINIPEVETHFIPLLIKKYGLNTSFNLNLVDQIFNDFFKTSFFWNIKKLNHVTESDLDPYKSSICSWSDFVNFIFNYFGPKGFNNETLNGDKTPGYINHIDTLRKINPNSRFIHIVRDPRDYCWSVRNIWNKNMYRAALNWFNTMNTLDGIVKHDSYFLQVKYEDLLQDVPSTLKSICEFLDIPFMDNMTSLSKTAENYGDAKGQKVVLKSNSGKFINRLSEYEIKKIEEITYNQLIKFEYKPVFANNQNYPHVISKKIWSLHDAFYSLNFHVKEKGLFSGVNYFLKLHNQSSWRV